MQRLKADLHTHTADDPHDCIHYTTEELIDAAAAAGVHVLAVTCHNARVYSKESADYAKARGVLLIPGVEQDIEGRHVLILNPEEQHLLVRTFSELRRIGKGNAVFIAPHPFYPIGCSLRRKFVENADLFDAVEYAAFYQVGCNFNRKAVRAARELGLPMVGNSDTHLLPYCDSTYSWIDAEPDIDAVLDAIRQGRTEVVTRPRPLRAFLSMLFYSIRGLMEDRVARGARRCVGPDEEVLPE
jgi:predicted metal-dependent phosphoesterase TrpH